MLHHTDQIAKAQSFSVTNRLQYYYHIWDILNKKITQLRYLHYFFVRVFVENILASQWSGYFKDKYKKVNSGVKI